MDSKTIRRLVECAILVAVGTVLSLFEFKGAWALGGFCYAYFTDSAGWGRGR